jgi:putative molybdopterin biosynthesis protein
MPTRNIYLEDVPLEEAWATFSAALQSAGRWQPLPAETIPLAEANGRVTAEAIWARLSAPHYHASAMDGYAVRAQDTEGATETHPLYLTLVQAGATVEGVERPAQPVNTGHPLPAWANAVVMVEHVQPIQNESGRSQLLIRAALPPWRHVRPMGEDMVATELVLPANHRLRPVDLGALAGSGHATVLVYRRPRVAIIPTGSELISAELAAEGGLQPGQIIEYNAIVLAAQVSQWGGLPTRWPIVPDELDAIQAAVQQATQYHDLVLVNAGSSAGSEDYTAHVVQSLGRLLVHGVAVRPGHPVILGVLDKSQIPNPKSQEAGTQGNLPSQGRGQELASARPRGGTQEVTEIQNPKSKIQNPIVPIIGVPGYPVSAALTGEIFVEPLLAKWQGQPAYQPPTVSATLTRKLLSSTGDDDYVRVTVGRVGDNVLATPIGRGAGVITSLVRADGIVRIPRFSEGADAGAAVTVHLYRSPAEIGRTIVTIGSHDLVLDILAQFLAERSSGLRLTSANVGSLGGLIALRRGEAHLAGSHLLDPTTGEYNTSYIRRYLPGEAIVLVTLAGREQGWIVPAGNPQRLATWANAANPDVTIVNRQRGAGTRVLLDYELGKLGIEPASVHGYDREEYTHLAVAAAVASGAATAGLGIRAAARALNLDFVPLAHEQYDLVIPQHQYESDLLAPLLALLYDDQFRATVAAMPGYDVRPMGQVIHINSDPA